MYWVHMKYCLLHCIWCFIKLYQLTQKGLNIELLLQTWIHFLQKWVRNIFRYAWTFTFQMNVWKRAVFQLIPGMILLSAGTEYPMTKITRMSTEMCNFLTIPFSLKSYRWQAISCNASKVKLLKSHEFISAVKAHPFFRTS